MTGGHVHERRLLEQQRHYDALRRIGGTERNREIEATLGDVAQQRTGGVLALRRSRARVRRYVPADRRPPLAHRPACVEAWGVRRPPRRPRVPATAAGVRVHLSEGCERLAEQALRAVMTADEAFLEPLDQDRRQAIATLLRPLLVGPRTSSPPERHQVSQCPEQPGGRRPRRPSDATPPGRPARPAARGRCTAAPFATARLAVDAAGCCCVWALVDDQSPRLTGQRQAPAQLGSARR